jgi:hypothetical protein
VLFGALAGFSAFQHARLAPGFCLLALAYAIPFTRGRFHAAGTEAARLASVRFLMQLLGLTYLVAAGVASPARPAFWLIGAVGLAIVLPVWLWGARLLAAAGREGDEVVRSKETN